MNVLNFKEENPMSKNLVLEAFTNEQLKTEVTSFNVGDTIRVHNRIKEGNRERIQLFEVQLSLSVTAVSPKHSQ